MGTPVCFSFCPLISFHARLICVVTYSGKGIPLQIISRLPGCIKQILSTFRSDGNAKDFNKQEHMKRLVFNCLKLPWQVEQNIVIAS
jgi:hypothetical protein